MSLFVVEPGNKLAPDSLVWAAVWTEKISWFLIQFVLLIPHYWYSLTVWKYFFSIWSGFFCVWWMLVISLCPFLGFFFLVFFLYKVQNHNLIKSVSLLKVKLFFPSYFKLPPLEASATALEDEARWDKCNLTWVSALHSYRKYVEGRCCLSSVRGISQHLAYNKGLTLIKDLWEASGVFSGQNMWIQLRSNLRKCTDEWDGGRQQGCRIMVRAAEKTPFWMDSKCSIMRESDTVEIGKEGKETNERLTG